MIRYQVRQQLAALVAEVPALSSVTVTTAYPGDKNLRAEAVWGDRTTGEVEFPYAMDGDKTSRDTFEVVLVARVTGKRTLDECCLRVEEITREVVQKIASTGLTLDGFAVDNEEVCEVGPISVQTREAEGDRGPIALAEITVTVETQTL